MSRAALHRNSSTNHLPLNYLLRMVANALSVITPQRLADRGLGQEDILHDGSHDGKPLVFVVKASI